MWTRVGLYGINGEVKEITESSDPNVESLENGKKVEYPIRH